MSAVIGARSEWLYCPSISTFTPSRPNRFTVATCQSTQTFRAVALASCDQVPGVPGPSVVCDDVIRVVAEFMVRAATRCRGPSVLCDDVISVVAECMVSAATRFRGSQDLQWLDMVTVSTGKNGGSQEACCLSHA
jgi:hypothetical protein